MNERHLGDSYDMVKFFWNAALRPIGRLYAHSDFIEPDLRTEYETLTKIRVRDRDPKGSFGLLLDRDTGVRPPDNKTGTRRSHISLDCIADLNREWKPAYLICYDQGFKRGKKDQQMKEKIQYLEDHYGLHSFYYVSHALFLFVSEKKAVRDKIREILTRSGIPKLERGDIGPRDPRD